ncbi:hypothetical protein BH11ARM2_BH11ARM2_26800 [soil metagenome]
MRSLLAGFALGILAAFAAWGGGHDPASLAKAVTIGFVSGYLAFRLVHSLTEINNAQAELGETEAFLEKALNSFNHPTADRQSQEWAKAVQDNKAAHSIRVLTELESSADARGAQPGVSEQLARRFGDRLAAKVPYARTTAGSAVYIGLAGTLLGLTFAVFGLRSLAGDADQLRTQILGVVSGFGGSFVCALCGTVATVWLSARLARYDAAVANVEASAETYAAEVLIPAAAPERKLAELVAETVGNALNERLKGFWAPLLEATENIKENTKALANTAKDIQAITEKAATATESLVLASAGFKETSAAILAILKATNASTKTLDASLTRLEPALKASTELVEVSRKAEEAMNAVRLGVQGIAAAVREETKVAARATVDEIVGQQAALRDAITPPLLQIARALETLRLVVERTEEAARDLPVAAPAARIVEDLRSVARDQASATERDARSVKEAAERLEATERRIIQAMAAVRSAHEDLQRSLTALGEQTDGVANHLDEVTERLDTPFWKRLAGRNG